MADYTVRIEATTEEAEKKLKRVDQRVEKLERGATIDIKLPSASQTLSTLQQIGSTTASVAKQAIQISKALNLGPGARLNDIEDLFNIVGGGANKTISALELLKKATPTNILGTAFTTASDQASTLAKRISNVGYEIFGLTQSVNILRQAFGGMFNETIGREIRLQESLLRTRTTLASTADVAVNGKRLTDPYEALIALEKPVEQTIENIRRRSLDIAGTTSDAIVQVFGVVASQVGAFGGTMKDAEDLAITFAGALGTIGMSDPMLANQEIRSILTGNIDQNSVLARSLGLTNAEIAKAKTSTEGLVGFLQRRLAAFTAGQSLAAKGFAGITSNIDEVREEALRSLGKPLLQPLLDSLTQVYTRLQLVFDEILKIGDGLGRIGSTVFSGIVSGIQAAPTLAGFSERNQIGAFRETEGAIADGAVQIQSAIDSIRPQIASLTDQIVKAFLMIGKGLKDLTIGFAQFKFEQLKIVLVNITNIAALLNSTLIPVLSEVLSLYGKILSSSFVQYLSQVNVQLQLLEKIGVLPAVRLGVAFVGIYESIKVVIGWIKIATEAIKTGLTTAVNAIGSGVQGLGTLIKEAGKSIVAITTQIVTTIIITAANGIKQIGIGLTSIANSIQTQFPRLSALATQISAVGTAFLNVERGAQQALVGVQRMATGTKLALSQVEQAAIRSADKMRNIGSIVGGFLVTNLGKLAKSLGGTVLSLIRFQIYLFLIEKGIGIVVDLIARWRRSQDEIADRTKAEIALQRLSIAYADLGENASKTAERLKEANEAIVSQRFDTVQKRIEELAPAYRKASKELARIQQQTKDTTYNTSRTTPLGATIVPGVGNGMDNPGVPAPVVPAGATTPGARANASAQARVQQLRKELETYYREKQRLEEYYEKQKSQAKDEEDVTILARERKDIETAIGEFRKEIEKELKNEKFRTAREVAQLEQQLAEENRRIERAALDRRLAREAQGLTGIRANIAQILGDYERKLFDAQTEAQRKQFEAVEARQNLEKAIADYKLRLEEQTTKMRKRMGDYNKQVADYESTQAERRNKERIKTALQAAAIEAERFVLGPDETRKFKDAASRQGVSSTQALSLLKTPGVIDSLGIVPDGNYDSLISTLRKSQYSQLLMMSQADFIQSLDRRSAALGAGAGRYTYDTAVAELGNQREFQKTVAPPPKLKGFSDFEKEQAQFVATQRSLNEQILNLRGKLNAIINVNNLRDAYTDTVEQLNNVELFTDLPTLQAATDSLADITDQLRLLQEAADSGATKLDPVTERLAALARTAPRAAEQFVISSSEFKKLTPEIRQRVAKAFGESMEKVIKTNQQVLTPELASTMKLLPKELTAMMVTVIHTVIAAKKRIQEVAPVLQRMERLQQGSEEYSAFIGSNKTFVRDNKLQAFQVLGQIAAGNSPLKSRQFEADLINIRRSFSFQDRGLLNDPENVIILKKMNAATKASYEELGKFEEALKNATARMELAEKLAMTMSEGYKRIFTESLRGGDITTIINDMLTSMQETLVGSFLDYAFKPLEKQMKSIFNTIFNVDNTEELVRKELITANSTAIVDNTAALRTLPEQIGAAVARGVASIRSTTTTASTAASNIASTGGQPADAPADPNVPKQQEQGKLLKDLNKGFAAATQAVVGVTLAMDGLRRVTESSSTYDTLMGIGSIFMGIGSVLGGIGGLGRRAAGGPVHARQPYLVGEKGPELFYPETFGTIVPNATTAALLANRNALAGKSPSAAADVFAPNHQAISATATLSRERYVERVLSSGASSTEIKYSRVGRGDLPFVTEDDMLQATRLAAEQGARIGQQRTLAALRNDPSVRRGIAI